VQTGFFLCGFFFHITFLASLFSDDIAHPNKDYYKTSIG